MDPLTILRDFTATQQLDAVVVQPGGSTVAFADKYAFPSDTPTAFRSKAGEHYSLLSVATFIKTVQAGGMTAYIASVGSLGVAPIEVADRRSLADYLSGKISHCANLAEVVPVVPLEPAAKKQRVAEPEEPDSQAAALLFGHEKQLRDRNSLLCAPGANFRSVNDMVDKVLKARKQMQMGVQASSAAGGGGKPQQAAAGGKAAQQQQQPKPQQQQQQFMKASGRMERQVDVRGTLKALGADASVAADVGLGYGMAAPTAGAAATAAAAAGAVQQQQPQQPAQPQQPPPPQQQQRSSSSKPAGGQPAKQARAAGSSAQRGSGGGGGKDKPIILVPQGFTALINRYNARQFLEHGAYVPSEEARQATNNGQEQVQQDAVIEFARTALRQGPKYPRYQIMDRPPPPKHPDWKRVVAVIVMGKPWQFKGFPHKGAAQGDMVDTFNSVFGAYLHFSDEAVPSVVRGWNVALLPLRRTARHLDATVMMEFYKKLDAFLASRRRSDLAT